jgi:hypothetical protein
MIPAFSLGAAHGAAHDRSPEPGQTNGAGDNQTQPASTTSEKVCMGNSFLQTRLKASLGDDLKFTGFTAGFGHIFLHCDKLYH